MLVMFTREVGVQTASRPGAGRCSSHRVGAMKMGAPILGLIAAAHAEDGVIEAVEVLWHPEERLDDLRLFAAVVEAARARAVLD